MTSGDLGLGLALMTLAVLAAMPWLPRPARQQRVGVRGEPVPTRRWRWPWSPRPASARVDEAVVLDLLRAALASGADVVSAIDGVGAALPAEQGAALQRAARSLRLGSTWEAAWPSGGTVPDALVASWVDGVDPEPLLAHAAGSIRRHRQAAAREAAARLGVRLVLPLGLCLLPAFVLLGLVPVLIAAGLDLWGG